MSDFLGKTQNYIFKVVQDNSENKLKIDNGRVKRKKEGGRGERK